MGNRTLKFVQGTEIIGGHNKKSLYEDIGYHLQKLVRVIFYTEVA